MSFSILQGQNLILNMNDHGFVVCAYNRTVAKVDHFLANEAKGHLLFFYSQYRGLQVAENKKGVALKLARLDCQNQRLTVYTVSTLNFHLPYCTGQRTFEPG